MTAASPNHGRRPRARDMTTTSPRPGLVALRAARLFDGVFPRVRERPLLILDGPVIRAVDYGVEPPVDVEVVDLGDVTLLPGLIDTHVHLAFDASADPVGALAAREDDDALSAMTDAALDAIRGGVTTLRDLGDRGYLSLLLRDRPGLPTIVAAGPPITTPKGHCHYLGGAASPGVDGVRRAVREHVERGVDVIKVMASGGHLTEGTEPSEVQFSSEELRAAVDEAHAAGLPITAHAHAPTSIARAVDAGVDGIEHATFWTREGVLAPDDLVRRLGDRRLVIGATAGYVLAGDGGLDEAWAERLPGIVEVMERLHAAGARILAGTDAGVGPTKPHDVLAHGLEQLVAVLGISPFDALVSATSGAAEVCQLGDRKGRLAPGYDADVIAVAGDPLADIAAVHSPRAVYVRGQLRIDDRRPG